MALAIKPRPDEADVFDMFSGKVRIATIRALHASTISPAAWSWWIVNVAAPGAGRGNAATLDKAVQAVADAWKGWLVDAQLEPADGQPVRPPYLAAILQRSPAIEPIARPPAPSDDFLWRAAR